MSKRTFFDRDDFSRDGKILFGKYAGQPVWELPERYYNNLLGHYSFNVTILRRYRTKPAVPSSTEVEKSEQ